MSRLSDLYKAMETLRKEDLSLNEGLEKQMFIGIIMAVHIIQCQKITMKADSICVGVIAGFVLNL